MSLAENPTRGGEDNNELLLDLAQLVLDIVGIFEPTPFADTTNAAISAARGDLLGTAVSLVSLVPYVGDLAKIGKLPRYVALVQRVVNRAASDAVFAKRAMPHLRRIAATLQHAPLDVLPAAARRELEALRSKVTSVVGDAGTAGVGFQQGLATSVKNYKVLPEHIRSMVDKALELPRVKSPRTLAKHPGPITEVALQQELKSKGFVQVKKGSHGTAGGGEDSDIYLRRIVDERGSDVFEAVRVDIRSQNPALAQSPVRTVDPRITGAQRQAQDKLKRQVHPLLVSPTTPAPKTLGNLLNDGWAYKGDYTHWHRETFPATDDNIMAYFRKKPITGLKKFDSMGLQVLHAR